MISVEESKTDYKGIISKIKGAIYQNQKEVKLTYKDKKINVYILSGYNIYSEDEEAVRLIRNINKILEKENARNKFNLVDCFYLNDVNNFLRFLHLKLNRIRDINQFNELGNFTNTIIKNKIFLVKINSTEEIIFVVFTNKGVLVKNYIDSSKTCNFLLTIKELPVNKRDGIFKKITQVYDILSTEKEVECNQFGELIKNLDSSQIMKIFHFLNHQKFYTIDIEYRLINNVEILYVLCPVEYLENCLHLTKNFSNYKSVELRVLTKEEDEINQIFLEFTMKKNSLILVNEKYLDRIKSAIRGDLNDSANNIDSTDTLSVIGQKIAFLVSKVYLSNINYVIQPFICNKYHLEICIKGSNIIVTENYVDFFESTTLMFLKVIVKLFLEESNKYTLLLKNEKQKYSEIIKKLNDVHVVHELNSEDKKLQNSHFF